METPVKVVTGETPDISNLMQFHWYEKVYYHDPVASFPESKEKLARFVGIVEHVGDTLTYKILTDDTNQVICRSVVQSAEKDLKYKNHQAERDTDLGERSKDVIHSAGEFKQKKTLPIVDPELLLGFTYIKKEDDGNYRAEVTGRCQHDPEKFLVTIGEVDREEVIQYSNLLSELEEMT